VGADPAANGGQGVVPEDNFGGLLELARGYEEKLRRSSQTERLFADAVVTTLDQFVSGFSKSHNRFGCRAARLVHLPPAGMGSSQSRSA